MLPRNHPDRIQIIFDDRRLVANAGLLLPATLARHLGLPELVRQRLDLGDAPGRANTSDKMMTLVASALAGHATGRQRVLHSWRGIRLPQDGCPLLHHHPPAQKPAQSH